MQDPSYDPYGFAKVATRTASSESGSAAACPGNVQKFFQTLFQLAKTKSGLDQINQDMSLCTDSLVTSVDQMNGTLAQFVQGQWVSAVSLLLPCICVHDLIHTTSNDCSPALSSSCIHSRSHGIAKHASLVHSVQFTLRVREHHSRSNSYVQDHQRGSIPFLFRRCESRSMLSLPEFSFQTEAWTRVASCCISPALCTLYWRCCHSGGPIAPLLT